MVIDEDPFLLVASVSITAIDLRAVLMQRKVGDFFLMPLWIPKQYMIHMDELVVKRRVSVAREKEKNGRYPYYSKQEIKKEKSSKGKNVSPKERHTFLEVKGMNTSRRKIPPRFVAPPPISP